MVERSAKAAVPPARRTREAALDLVLNLETAHPQATAPHCRLRLDVGLAGGAILSWKLEDQETEAEVAGSARPAGVEIRLRKVLELKVPLPLLQAANGDKVRLCFSAWKDGLPIDSLPIEGCIEVQVLSEAELAARS